MVHAIIDAQHVRSYATLSLGDGTCAVDRVLAACALLADTTSMLVRPGAVEVVPGEESPYLSVDTGRVRIPLGVGIVPVEDGTPEGVLSKLSSLGEGADALVYVRADEPYMIVDEAQRILDEHVQYRAHYSFADGYPAGATPVVLSPSLPRLLIRLVEADDDTGSPDWLFTVLQRDINSFDVETLLSPVDFRMLRITFRCDTRANFVLCSRFLPLLASKERATVVSRDQYVSSVADNYSKLRTLPMYMSVEVTAGVSQQVVYNPLVQHSPENEPRFMPADRFSALVTQLDRLSPEAVVGICTWGEPLKHPELEALLEAVCATDSLSLVVETGGIGRSGPEVVQLAERYGSRVTWIVALDAIDEAVYGRIRGEGFAEAMAFAEHLVAEIPDRSYVQAVRMKETEAHLETFWRYWKQKTDHIIIQKYDDVCGLLPARKVTDLSPVQRFPCWHNKRDLYVRLNGDVPRCREDIRTAYGIGNLFREPMEDVWNRGDELHLKHVSGTYPELCEQCDEYYTFNF